MATVWEEALAYGSTAMPMAGADFQPAPVDVGLTREVTEELETHARRVAEDGAEQARAAGLEAEAVPIAGDASAADAIVEMARKRGVAAIVIGSRGLTGLRARVEGSVSSGVVKHAACPVLVVHDD